MDVQQYVSNQQHFLSGVISNSKTIAVNLPVKEHMIRISLPFYFQFIDSFQLKPLIVRDRFGTEVWFLNMYLALELGGKDF